MGRMKKSNGKPIEANIISVNNKPIEQSPAEVETTVPPTVTNGVIVNALLVNVRREPCLNADVLEVLRKGDKVAILEKGTEFWKVSTSVNKIAYISSDFVMEV